MKEYHPHNEEMNNSGCGCHSNGQASYQGKQVHQDMIISDVLRVDSGLEELLFRAGMHCLGCPSSQMESLGEACEVHGIEAKAMIDHLNAYLLEKASWQIKAV